MLLHFSERLRLLIWSSSVQITFQILSIILVVASVKVAPATASSAADYSSSYVYASSSSVFFSLHLTIDSNIYWSKLYYFCYFFSYFWSRWFRLLVTLILSFLSRWFHISRLVDFLNCRDFFVLKYQLKSSHWLL